MNWEKVLYVQYLIQLKAHVTINVCYFVMVILHVSISKGHLQGDYLQRNIFILNAVQDLHIYEFKI